MKDTSHPHQHSASALRIRIIRSALRMLCRSDKGTIVYTRSHRPSPTQLSAHAPRTKNPLQVRRLVAALRPVGRAAQRDAQPAVSCVALTEAVASGPEGRAAFLNAEGAAALLELLDSRNAEVRNRAGIAALYFTAFW